MMTKDEFVMKYYQTKVDYDGQYGYQCVDLFRQYCKDAAGVTEFSTGGVTGAKDLYLLYKKLPLERKYFERA
jgi:hypothetical protein